MREPHRIRLRGPWEYEALARYDGDRALPPPGKVTMPGDWSSSLGSAFRGLVRYVRRFGQPGFVEPYEQMWIVLEAVRGDSRLSLNGEPLGELASGQPGSFEVTGKILFRNVLEVLVEQPLAAAEPGGLVGEVRMEID